MVNLTCRSTILMNANLVELERLGNFSWSGAVFGEFGARGAVLHEPYDAHPGSNLNRFLILLHPRERGHCFMKQLSHEPKFRATRHQIYHRMSCYCYAIHNIPFILCIN
jgi:hypothetical protein